MAKKNRIDILIFQKGLTTSLSKATALVMEGKVSIKDKIITKPGFLVSEDSEILIKESDKYVSRGGLKLEEALKKFAIDVKDKICIDIGASTGGFTDCLLQKGAKKVYCIDVGYGILDFKLRNDPRVVVFEKTNIRYFGKPELSQSILSLRARHDSLAGEAISSYGNIESYLPDLAVIDVSFISLEKVLPKVKELVKTGAKIIALVKPQFEAPRGSTKKGVVEDEAVRTQTIEKIKEFAKTIGLKYLNETSSPIKGPKGNLEHLLYFEL
jgi:23S rRNA (cytidine1920-2'-O)/16S rRNA (cytidine1409-2'-O)-methyltransferase